MLISSLIFTMKIVIPMRLLGECDQDCKMVKTIPRYCCIIKQVEQSFRLDPLFPPFRVEIPKHD